MGIFAVILNPITRLPLQLSSPKPLQCAAGPLPGMQSQHTACQRIQKKALSRLNVLTRWKPEDAKSCDLLSRGTNVGNLPPLTSPDLAKVALTSWEPGSHGKGVMPALPGILSTFDATQPCSQACLLKKHMWGILFGTISLDFQQAAMPAPLGLAVSDAPGFPHLFFWQLVLAILRQEAPGGDSVQSLHVMFERLSRKHFIHSGRTHCLEQRCSLRDPLDPGRMRGQGCENKLTPQSTC